MELRMTQEIAELVPRSIRFNYGELKHEINAKLERYKNMVITEDDIPGAKKDRAALNKLAEALNSQRIEQQQEYMRPFITYKSQVDELIGMIKEPVKAIDRQLKIYDDARKEEKKAALTACFEANVGDLKGLLSPCMIWSGSWLNATYPQSKAEKEIIAALNKVRNDLEAIRGMRAACEQQMIDKYLQTLDMPTALAEKKRFEELQKKLEERKAVGALKAVKNVPEAKAVGTQATTRSVVQYQAPPAAPAPSEAEPLQMIKFWVKVTPAQKQLMRDFLVSNNIPYGSVK